MAFPLAFIVLAYSFDVLVRCDRKDMEMDIVPTSSPKEFIDLNNDNSDKESKIPSNIRYPVDDNSDKVSLISTNLSLVVEELQPVFPSTASINALLSVFCLLLNLIIITFYWSNSPNLSSMLYLLNAIADSISAVG